MLSEVAICNMALNNMGIGRVISKLTDTTEEARACRRWYENTRDQLLQEYPWNWCCAVTELAQAAEESPLGAYVYIYPAQALRIRNIFPAGSKDTRSNWLIRRGADGRGKVIIADVSPAWAEYTVRVTDATEFPPLFADALSWLLASRLVLALKGDGEARRQDIMQFYAHSKERAVMTDANEGLREGVNVGALAAGSAESHYIDVRA